MLTSLQDSVETQAGLKEFSLWDTHYGYFKEHKQIHWHEQIELLLFFFFKDVDHTSEWYFAISHTGECYFAISFCASCFPLRIQKDAVQNIFIYVTLGILRSYF